MEDFGKSIAQNARQTGESAVNAFNPTQTQKNFLGDYNSMTAGQFGQAQDYTKRFADTISSNPSATDYYQRGNEAYGVQPLMEQANYLNTQVTNAVPNAYKTARGFDVSDHQVQNAANVNLRFLQPQATAATGQAQVAQQLAAGYADRGMQQTDINLRPITAEGQFIQSQQEGQGEAYRQANAQEMTGLISKMQSGVKLSELEYARLNELIQAESAQRVAREETERQRVANQGSLANTIQGQKYQVLDPNQRLVNTFAQSTLDQYGRTRRY
jgi:hypothetical protein